MKSTRIIVLGKENAGDDEAAILATRDLETDHQVIIAGRPGLNLVEILETEDSVILVDVIKADLMPGSILNISMKELQDAALADVSYSSHGFGPAESLKLMKSLDQQLPSGRFVGIEGRQFRMGAGLSGMVQDKLPKLREEIIKAVAHLNGIDGNFQ